MNTKDITSKYDELHSVEDTETAHLAGVFDSGGTISLNVVKDSDYRLGYTVRPSLRVIRSDEDDPVLGKLVGYCDEQSVRYNIIEMEKSSGSTSYKWITKDPDSIKRFLEPLMEYLLTEYFRAELMIEVIIPAIKDGKHTEQEGFYELVGLAEKLREGSATRTEPKYTQDYFEDEWSIIE